MSFEAYARKQAKAVFDTVADRLVKDLSTAAQEEIDKAAAKARQEAERAADEKVAAARAESEARLHATEQKLATARAEGEARLAAAQAMNAGLLESVEGAREEVRAAQTAAKAEIERVRQDLETRLEHLKQERAQIVRARDEAGKRLDAETRRAGELDAHLDVETRRASELGTRLDVETRRANELQTQLEAATRRAAELGEALNASGQDREVGIDQLRAALSSIDRATSPSEILEALLDPLAQDFARAAVFLVGPKSLYGWRDRGLSPATDVAKVVIPRASESLLARAVAGRKQLAVSPAPGEPVLSGLSGSPVARAVALPVLAGGHVVAVVYAEDERKSSKASFPGVGYKIARILIDHATLRLSIRSQAQHTQSSQAASAAAYSPERQAPRLKLQDDVDVTVDGSESSLVDVSSIGAQILSSVAMRPNKVLRMTLKAGERALQCKGRVMWARFEPARGSSAAHYRVGVKFTEVDPKTVEAFIAGQAAAHISR